MGVSKTGFLFGITIFYTVVLLLTSLMGASLQKENPQLLIPTVSMSNLNNDYTSDNEMNCISTLKDGFQFTDLLPQFLRVNCIKQYANNKFSDYEDSNKFKFMPSVIAGFSNVPSWFNALFFLPLIVTMLYFLLTTIGGALFDGGS